MRIKKAGQRVIHYIITDMGEAIGTKGERLIKIVFDTAGKIWTAYPMK